MWFQWTHDASVLSQVAVSSGAMVETRVKAIGSARFCILALGIAGEVIVPWAVIELSDLVLFNVPFWALWPIFAGPLTLALATALVVWLVRTRGTAPRERRLSSAATDGHTTAQQRHPNHQ